MNLFKYYRLEKNQDGYTLILYVDMGLTEFAEEFGSGKERQIQVLNKTIGTYIEEKFPRLRINCVKLMIGSVLIASITIRPTLTYAEESNNTSVQEPDFHMTYAYFGSTNTLIQNVEKSGDILDVVSPSYFDLNEDGTLLLSDLFDPYFIEEMHEDGIKVVPFLSNHWDRAKGKAALDNTETLVSQIAHVIEEYGLDGINVDIENVGPEERQQYVELVKQLRETLPAEKEVSVAVAANPTAVDVGWQGSYDYEALAQYADYLMVMAYDEHYSGDIDAGPVASIHFVEQSIQYALEKVPADKIVLGIPLFGRYWKNDGSVKGKGVSLKKANELITRYNGIVKYDSYAQSPEATFYVNGYEPGMSAGSYTIWYENEESILHKLELIKKYNLKGSGSWSLSQATENIWKYYNQWVEKNDIFIDVGEGWAKEPILAVSEKGWMVGTRDFYFEPNAALIRAQAATLLVRILELEKDEENLVTFSDVSDYYWAKENIEIVAQNGLMEGIGNNMFAPNKSLTREEMAALLSRLLEIGPLEEEIVNPFKDIDVNQWSYPFVMAMVEEGIYEGYGDQSIRPKENITRAQMAALLERIGDRLTEDHGYT